MTLCLFLAGLPAIVLAAPPAQQAPANPFDVPFEAPEKKAFSDFPAVELRTQASATYIGLQFGTGRQDVAYICFDTEDIQKIRDRAYFHMAGSTNPPVLERGRNVMERQARNVKLPKEKPQRFEFAPIRARIGDHEVDYKIACVYGHGNTANLFLVAETAIKSARTMATCILHADLSNIAVPVPSEIKVVQLIGPAKLNLFGNNRVNPPSIRPYVSIGSSILVEPLRGMDKHFNIQVRPKGETKVVEKEKLDIDIPEYCGVGNAGAGEIHQLKTSKPGPYDVDVSVDMGPFGMLSATTNVTVAPKIKAK